MTGSYSDIKTYDELLIENEQLHTELTTTKDALIDSLAELVDVKAELANHATFQHIDDDRLAKRNMELEAENKRLRAELAALKSARVDEASDYLDSISDGARGIE